MRGYPRRERGEGGRDRWLWDGVRCQSMSQNEGHQGEKEEEAERGGETGERL